MIKREISRAVCSKSMLCTYLIGILMMVIFIIRCIWEQLPDGFAISDTGHAPMLYHIGMNETAVIPVC